MNAVRFGVQASRRGTWSSNADAASFDGDYSAAAATGGGGGGCDTLPRVVVESLIIAETWSTKYCYSPYNRPKLI